MQGTALNGAVPTSPTASSPYEYLKKIEDAAVASPTANSVADLLVRQNGLLVTKTLTCNGDGAQKDNIFTLTGTVDVLEIWGVCTEATNSTDLADCYLNLNDATADLDLTDHDAPTDCSGMAVGDVVFKNGASATVALAYHDIATGELTDLTQTIARISKKTAAATNIQFCFNGDANTDVDIKFYVRYRPISDDGALVAA